MEILKQLLFKSGNKWQIAGAAVGTFIGLFLLLNSLQFYRDLTDLTSGRGGQSDQFVLINKKVNLFNTLGARSTFSEEEIDELKGQPFIKEVGIFTPNQFKVSASSKMLGFYTELFFESVPDQFLDVEPDSWDWKKGQNEIPVVLSRDYLALYNFGFAPSQGLPQFTAKTIKRVTVDIKLSGNGLSKIFQGRIVGFSDRINSVIIPQSLMNWANETFGSNSQPASSRLLLATDNPYSTELADFLQSNNYELSSGRLIGGQLKTLIGSVVSLIAFIGFIIALLSVLIFILNFQLLISRASGDIQLLLQLGYRPGQIQRLLSRQLALLFGGVLLLTLITLFISRHFLLGWYNDQGFDLQTGLHWSVWLLALIFSTLFLLINFRSIQTNVRRLFQP
ncbi:MAG: hypothetical protein AAGG75_01160 [Bacteroidota bacterium]